VSIFLGENTLGVKSFWMRVVVAGTLPSILPWQHNEVIAADVMDQRNDTEEGVLYI